MSCVYVALMLVLCRPNAAALRICLQLHIKFFEFELNPPTFPPVDNLNRKLRKPPTSNSGKIPTVKLLILSNNVSRLRGEHCKGLFCFFLTPRFIQSGTVQISAWHPRRKNKAMTTCASSVRVTFDQRIASLTAMPSVPQAVRLFVVSPEKLSQRLIRLLSFMRFTTAGKKGMYTFPTRAELKRNLGDDALKTREKV